MREKLIVDHGGLISVAPDRMPWPGGCVLDHGDLEALLMNSRRCDSTHILASMPPRMILAIPRLRNCSTRSLVCGPNTLCGLTTIVLPSLMYGLKRSSQSAPEFGKPVRSSDPVRANEWFWNSSVSSGPFIFQPLSVG